VISRQRLYNGFKKAIKTFLHFHGKPEDNVEMDVEATIGKYRKTRVLCSNPDCCGNPRRSKSGKYRLTRQERRIKDSEKEQLKEG
jgi:hypothetical protein